MSADSLAFVPLLRYGLLASLAVLLAAAILLGLFRRAPGVLYRLAAFVVALLFLAGPERIHRTGTALPAIALLAVDRSGSMQVGNRGSLAEAAAAKLTAEARAVPGLTLRRVDIADSGTAGTALFAGIDAALADIPPDQRAGVIAITDGAVTDAPARFVVPLHALIPARGEQIDRRLQLITAPGYGIVGQTAHIALLIDDLGAPAGAAAHLTWSQDGVPIGAMDAIAGQPAGIDIPIAHPGRTTVAIDVAALPGEASTRNNRVALTINGVRDRLRVLLISGQPHEGERSWRRLLKSDPGVDLVHFTILRPPGKDDFTPISQLALIAFPTRELFVQKIRDFDLIVLDRFSETNLLPETYVQNIADYVRGGGALLVSAGPEFADASSIANGPIGDVLPASPAADNAVVTGAFRPTVSAVGKRHPVTEGLPGDTATGPPGWGAWYRRIAVGPTQGEVVMQAGDGGAPLLILNRVGQGRVALLLSDQIWLWSRGHQGGGPQAELLRRVAHWLMGEPQLDETALTASIADGTLIIERHALADPPPGAQLVVTDPDGTQTRLGLPRAADGSQRISLPAATPGLWRADFAGQTAYAAAAPTDPTEWEDLRATATHLRPIAASVHWLDSAGAPSLADLKLRRIRAVRLTGLASTALFPAVAALPLLLLLLLLGWWREGR